ncbi:DUF3325 domain-containing protein [Caldimonas tepidiphila]|uniref:DUF3325 domain-containing protein n=1 Tax=Caldimonas tepidiphila TaxID=2315841 RepID=UPI000E5C56F9|nr:DUF3325 domain-containing protein [Caldimonas tepidiphila]
MSESLWLIAANVLSFSGMAWLALAMEVHWEQVRRGPAAEARRPCRLLRGLGVAALLFSLLACLQADRPSMAVLVWMMLLAGGAVAVAMTLARRPGLLVLLWPFGPAMLRK